MIETALVALGIFFVVTFVRALPWPDEWQKHKPLSCDACMVGWALIALVLAQLFGSHTAWSIRGIGELLATGGCSMLFVALYGYWKGPAVAPLRW